MIEHLFTGLLLFFPHFPMRPCVTRRQPEITRILAVAQERYGVPPPLFLSVGFHETHLGCDANEGGGWGAPINRRNRHVAGTPLQAARVLARGWLHCGSWLGAARYFNTGMCDERHDRRRYGPRILRLAQIIEARAGTRFEWGEAHLPTESETLARR